MIIDSAVVAAFAPTGALRAAINLGNPILASAVTGSEPKGVSVELARGFAERLGRTSRDGCIRRRGQIC